ncbi:MAG TPA: hypothetical protein HA230_05645 [Candidatus Aenigmarchaeota archaeon]|nr:hypothetical protein [Candidatus Aenigmarchaeota archaeon]
MDDEWINMQIPRRDEGMLVACLEEAKRYVDLIHRQDYDPERNARNVISYLEQAELVCYKPEGEFKKSLQEYETLMADVVKTALNSACGRHMTEQNTSVTRDAQKAMDMLPSYASITKLKVGHYLTIDGKNE